MEIETGQVWIRKGGTGFGEDQITILADVSTPDDEFERWEVQYGDGETIELFAPYIQDVFEYKSDHPKSVRIIDQRGNLLLAYTDSSNSENVVISSGGGVPVVLRPADIDTLTRWFKNHRYLYPNA